MIDLYFWTTPNGYKISILLEELGLDYEVIAVDLGKRDQFEPEFLKVNPNNKIPAILDHEGPEGNPYRLFESGAIMIYLAEKVGRLLPSEPAKRHEVLQWLMFQMAGVGPMFGQALHFRHGAGEEYARERYDREAMRLFGVMEQALEGREHFAGAYSIADIAIFPWVRLARSLDIQLDGYPNLKGWYERIAARPAVKRGLAVLGPGWEEVPLEAKERLFTRKEAPPLAA
ncbi:MAG: glutathione binding-like protein [Alphaproteobacteria bacterium]